MDYFSSFISLFYPNLCNSCKSPLNIGETVICSGCRHNLPQTNFHTIENNQIEKIFYGRAKINFATSFLFFNKSGLVQNLIHSLKYRGNQEIGSLLGKWFGKILKSETGLRFDYIISVPLHKNKEKKRGFNQLDTFGEALAEIFNAEYSKNNLVRVYESSTQTKKDRFARWKNVKEIFVVNNPKLFENKKVLLIDDIITTGATLEACCHQLEKSETIEISIVTMAFTV